MTNLQKRYFTMAAMSAVAAAALVGCGKKEEPKPVAAAPAPAASAPAPKPEPLKIAFAYVGPEATAAGHMHTTTPARPLTKPMATRSSPVLLKKYLNQLMLSA